MSNWIKFEDRQPNNSHAKILMKFSSGIICSGSLRYGHLGEPSQDTYAWRCDCCGRFATPYEWAELK